MHPYASEARARGPIYLALSVAAVISAWFLQRGLAQLEIPVPWWVDTPSVLGFFGLYWKWFDVKLWRLKWIQERGWLLPDLGGRWRAEIRTSRDGKDIQLKGDVQIRQTWSRISLAARWPDSESCSASAVLQDGPGLQPEFVYTFVNEPKAHAVSTMEMHRGTVWLRLEDGRNTLRGHYYSGRGRQQFGEIKLSRA